MIQNTQPWAREFDRCKACQRTDRKHMAKGLCVACYSAQYADANPARTRSLKNAWYVKNGGKAWSKEQREQRNYSGQREAVLKRDGYACTRCKATRGLVVHHSDRRGRTVPPAQKNNVISNLTTLCRKCHINEHRKELLNVRAANNFRRPSGLQYKTRKAG